MRDTAAAVGQRMDAVSCRSIAATKAEGDDLLADGQTVLARAVRWHLEDRVLVYGNRTVVFD